MVADLLILCKSTGVCGALVPHEIEEHVSGRRVQHDRKLFTWHNRQRALAEVEREKGGRTGKCRNLCADDLDALQRGRRLTGSVYTPNVTHQVSGRSREPDQVDINPLD